MTRRFLRFLSVLRGRPQAWACLSGSPAHPNLTGRVDFYQTRQGVLVAAEVSGLPQGEEPCKERIFGFHIHSGTQCTGNESDPFADTLTHYDPAGCEHPNHPGDLPPLFGNGGYAFQVVLTRRFTLREILGKTVVIHAHPDDFTSQPAGHAGEKIACGEILAVCSGGQSMG